MQFLFQGQTACDLAEADFLKVAENCRKRSKELGKVSVFNVFVWKKYIFKKNNILK